MECSLLEKTGSEKNIEKLAKYIANIHKHDINKNKFKIYNAEWVIEQVCKSKDVHHKSDIILALESMSQIESHNASQKKSKLLTWDIAFIINHANDVRFSEIFLESYLRHGGGKPTLAALYANLYYVQVSGAVEKQDLKSVAEVTKGILEDTVFDTDIISYDTLIKLNIIGY